MPFIQLQFRRDTAYNWTCTNPILASGEMGIELDTHLFKIGDGGSQWTNLPYGGIQGVRGPTGPSGALTSTISTNLIPTGSTPQDIGSSQAKFRNIYLNGSLFFGTSQLSVSGTNLQFTDASGNLVVLNGGGGGGSGTTGATGPTGASGQGVPSGGSINQVLAKASSTNYDTHWVTPSSGGSGNASSYYIDINYVGSGTAAFSSSTTATSITADPNLAANGITVTLTGANINIVLAYSGTSSRIGMPTGIFLAYASGTNAISSWDTNPQYSLYSPVAGQVISINGTITSFSTSWGLFAGTGRYSGAWDNTTTPRVLGRVLLSFGNFA